jgi:hypothetical protein
VAHKDPDELFLREDTERDLVFAGFLVVSSPVKSDSLDTIAKLKRSATSSFTTRLEPLLKSHCSHLCLNKPES